MVRSSLLIAASSNWVAPEAADSSSQPTSTPDASWTVVRLREEARARGLTGMSKKSKAEVLAALT
jgi:hypothetical protein